MADHRAIMGISAAIVNVLQANYRPEEFNDQDAQFRVFSSRDFENPIQDGVSLFLYRIYPNGVNRTPPGRIGADGRRLQTSLPLDLHFLLTVWGMEATRQHTLAGWMMRTLEDIPILPAGLLNAGVPGVFRADETVEITPAELRTEDLLRLYEVLMPNVYQLSVPYMVRIVTIESIRPARVPGGPPMQERDLRWGRFEPPESRS